MPASNAFRNLTRPERMVPSWAKFGGMVYTSTRSLCAILNTSCKMTGETAKTAYLLWPPPLILIVVIF